MNCTVSKEEAATRIEDKVEPNCDRLRNKPNSSSSNTKSKMSEVDFEPQIQHHPRIFFPNLLSPHECTVCSFLPFPLLLLGLCYAPFSILTVFVLLKELEFIHKCSSTVGYRPNVFSTTLSHLIATNSSQFIIPFIPIRGWLLTLTISSFVF